MIFWVGRSLSLYLPMICKIYPATSLDDAEAVVHVIKMSENDLRKQQVNGFYSDVELSLAMETDDITKKEQELEGVKTNQQDDIYTLLESSCKFRFRRI